jgi:hypothetical protein
MVPSGVSSVSGLVFVTAKRILHRLLLDLHGEIVGIGLLLVLYPDRAVFEPADEREEIGLDPQGVGFIYVGIECVDMMAPALVVDDCIEI